MVKNIVIYKPVHYTTTDLINFRLRNHQLSRQKFKSPAELVKHFGAMQAQDYSGAKWAIGLRLKNVIDSNIEKSIAERKIIRAWPLRGTLHFIAADDIRRVLELTAPQMNKASSIRDKQLGIDEKLQSKSKNVFERCMAGKKELTREELITELNMAGIKANGVILSHLLYKAGRDQLVCFGVKRGKQFTYTLLDDWVPKTKMISREEALAELTRTYFKSHGPAQLKDFAWWAGITAGDAKTGLEIVKPALISLDINGSIYWQPNDLQDTMHNISGVYLLPWWDEYLVAYKDRSAVLDPSFTKMVNAGGGMLNPVIILNGRVAGTWKREIKNDTIIIRINKFVSLSRSDKDKIILAAEKYGKFYDTHVHVEFKKLT
ncbi:MAG: winged helix DNA-binding domain-containing protein [Ignavibacteriaceae bacterium]